MLPFDMLFCPCCTGAMLHTLAQTSASWSQPQWFLELGKGALTATIGIATQAGIATQPGIAAQPDINPSPKSLTQV